MVEQVKSILERSFLGIEVDLEQLSNGRITGTVVWPGFAEYDQVDRQATLRAALSDELKEAITQVGVILTYTPDELYAMQAA
jgi:acid stress-induced BolA-like protein IbaG/YrbA